jgi:hypothetical protein
VKEQIVEALVKLEWRLFDKVHNAGGRASCQDDWKTFLIMRGSQFMTWPEDALLNCLEGFQEAEQQGRNIIAEKYARMMEHTFPSEYADLKEVLPPVPEDTRKQIDEIVAISLEWARETAGKYPNLRVHGRPLEAGSDRPYAVSFETYLRSEYMTYSRETVDLLHRHILQCKTGGRNLGEEELGNMMSAYGFDSLAEANEKVRPS